MRPQSLPPPPPQPKELFKHWEAAAYITTPRLLHRQEVASEVGYSLREANLTADEIMWVTLHEGTGAGFGLKKLPHHAGAPAPAAADGT